MKLLHAALQRVRQLYITALDLKGLSMVYFFDNFFNVFTFFKGVFQIDHMIGAMFCGVLLLLFLVTFFISLIRGLR